MDDTQRAFYGLKFENAFLRLRGKAFESFFVRLMGHGFAGDFELVRPYGARGDLKCDGFRRSDGTVFQVYAPDSLKLAPLLAKIDKDFTGAIEHWGRRMRRWEFVHNDDRGLPGDAVQKLVDLHEAHPVVGIKEAAAGNVWYADKHQHARNQDADDDRPSPDIGAAGQGQGLRHAKTMVRRSRSSWAS